MNVVTRDSYRIGLLTAALLAKAKESWGAKGIIVTPDADYQITVQKHERHLHGEEIIQVWFDEADTLTPTPTHAAEQQDEEK